LIQYLLVKVETKPPPQIPMHMLKLARTTKTLIAYQYIRELRLFDYSSAIPIYVDRKTCRDLVIKSPMLKRSRHFEIYPSVFKQYIGNLKLLEPVHTEDDPVNILTKSLGPKNIQSIVSLFFTAKGYGRKLKELGKDYLQKFDAPVL